jgi:transposase
MDREIAEKRLRLSQRLTARKRKFHVILDDLNTDKPKNDRWLKSHPHVHLHFTPTHTSWLNQIECWFSI